MELSLLHYHHHIPTSIHPSLNSFSIPRTRTLNRNASHWSCRCSSSSSEKTAKGPTLALQCAGRRALVGCFLASAVGICVSDMAGAVSTSRRALRGAKIPEEDFVTLPNGLKYYDLKVGGGAEAVKGSRVAVHYVAKWKGITFMTSRQGMGVSGGTVRLLSCTFSTLHLFLILFLRPLLHR
ncbi:hypothetical protein RHGRI_007125 [Rhododendron griersonianum]|uniref:Peptidylprolyl isomerase n=1 Tax=Rhododendron griersonianum TaxID=479676 RepID=A0AAV6KXC5_9ERIC|nr:hypothetical protein RHGRI_007125 [Rhododendron griersonianum]KAG5556753.1 hypothetical protein RHGRI_007125 [Rhododendron griersonianum]